MFSHRLMKLFKGRSPLNFFTTMIEQLISVEYIHWALINSGFTLNACPTVDLIASLASLFDAVLQNVPMYADYESMENPN